MDGTTWLRTLTAIVVCCVVGAGCNRTESAGSKGELKLGGLKFKTAECWEWTRLPQSTPTVEGVVGACKGELSVAMALAAPADPGGQKELEAAMGALKKKYNVSCPPDFTSELVKNERTDHGINRSYFSCKATIDGRELAMLTYVLQEPKGRSSRVMFQLYLHPGMPPENRQALMAMVESATLQ
jgi:hypothetical protein